MRFISITKSINIRLDWANITGTVLKAGTPISLTGVVANTADAVGILSQDVSKSDAVVAVVTEGTIDLGEIAASYGELDDAAISAMHGITFINDGEPVAPSGGGGGLPDYSEAAEGDVLSIDGNGEPAWAPPSGGGGALYVKMTVKSSTYSCDKTYSEINAAYAAGTPVIGYLLKLNSVTSAVSRYYIARELYVSASAASFYFTESVSINTGENLLVEASRFGVGSGGGLVYELDSIDVSA